MSEPTVLEQLPRPAEYRELRQLAGLSPRSQLAAQRGLPNSLFGVCVRDGERLIGMGRVIGDGGLNFDIVDVAVHPDYQRRGLGSKIMQALMDYIHRVAPETAYVSLLADEPGRDLYRKFGFEFTAPGTVGMAIRISRSDAAGTASAGPSPPRADP